MLKCSFRFFHNYSVAKVEASEYEEAAYDVSERISLLDAMHFLQAAWSEVDDQVSTQY